MKNKKAALQIIFRNVSPSEKIAKLLFNYINIYTPAISRSYDNIIFLQRIYKYNG